MDKNTKRWGNYSEDEWNAPSKAVVVNTSNGEGVVLWYVGPHISMDVEEHCITLLSDLGLDEAPPGISVWEGKYQYQSSNNPENPDVDAELLGEFRPPTEEEWKAIRENRNPWKSSGADSGPPLCEGEGTCHGSQSWCDCCGDVTWVCDDPSCDHHLMVALGGQGHEGPELEEGRKLLAEQWGSKPWEMCEV